MIKGLNVNWIRHLVLDNENQFLDDSVWFPKQDKIFADFSIVMSDSSKMVSFLGHRQVDYSHIQLNPVIPDRVLKMDNNVIIDNNVLKNDDRFWDTIRPYALSGKEKQIYGMVDSIKNVPLYQNIYTIVSMVLGGYYDTVFSVTEPMERRIVAGKELVDSIIPSTIYRLRSYRLLSNTMSCSWERESMRLPKEIS